MRELYLELDAMGGARTFSMARATLPGNQPPWQQTGLALARGQAYTLMADGIIHWSERHPQLYGGPGFHLWARVNPGGHIVNVTRHSGSFVADVAGELELGIYFGMWRDKFGALDTPPSVYSRLRGELEVIALAWPASAEHGLAALADVIADPYLRAELDRLRAPTILPDGWAYLPETGITDIYRTCTHAGHRAVCLNATDDQGIIRKAVDFELTPTTAIHWRWRLDQHPSRVAEDSNLTHDYVSVATEFDNGRDLTWIWSSSLPRGHHFHCPIKAWQERETHMVVRNGDDARGQWTSERRQVHADVTVAMGTPPSRIVAVWLICVATFQHGDARAAFEAIALSDQGRQLTVL